MNIYLISQTENTGYDTYDSAVVCAENEEEARTTHPNTNISDIYWNVETETWWSTYANSKEKYEFEGTESYTTWCHIDKVKVKLLGDARRGSKKGVICASFNAG